MIAFANAIANKPQSLPTACIHGMQLNFMCIDSDCGLLEIVEIKFMKPNMKFEESDYLKAKLHYV